MFPSVSFERQTALLCEERDHWLACAWSCDASDLGHGDSGNRAGQTGGDWRGEEQFVVLAAVEGLVEGCCRMDRQKSRIGLGGDARLLAEMSKVCGEAVAQVERGGGQAAALQPQSLGNARPRIEVRGQQRFQLFGDSWRIMATGLATGQLSQAGKTSSGSAQSASDVEQVTRFRARTQQRATSGNGADQHNISYGQR